VSAAYDRSGGREILGLVIILIGFSLLMNTMGILPFGPIVSRFWLPVAMIGVGLWQMSRARGSGTHAGLFFVLFGALFFVSRLTFWNISMGRMIGPAILIWIGLSMLIKRSRPQRFSTTPGFRMDPSADPRDFIEATAILGGFHRKCSSQQFRGGDFTAIMGGGKIDLRDAHIQADEAVLEVFALMGGIEIQIPPDWTVDQRFTPILGGFEDKTRQNPGNTKRLSIHGTAIMGGVSVMN